MTDADALDFDLAPASKGTRYARINRSFIAHSVLEELISFTNVKRGVISEMLRVQNLNRTQEI
ncbi:hypothetical protein ACS0TY_028069 [Phlomoides rotata]